MYYNLGRGKFFNFIGYINIETNLPSEAQVTEFREAFAMFDKDGDGSISVAELGESIRLDARVYDLIAQHHCNVFNLLVYEERGWGDGAGGWMAMSENFADDNRAFLALEQSLFIPESRIE
jgi:hypothetical protein